MAAQVLRWEGARTTRVEVALLDAAAMRRLNRRVTGRRGLTDVLAFGLPQPDGRVLGDVYVCPAAAERYVEKEGREERGAVDEELVRLAVHGT
ncbi:MAG TPA: rRNA maturation RNAse YbeY, partial [Gemmatimonadales bacterium]